MDVLNFKIIIFICMQKKYVDVPYSTTYYGYHEWSHIHVLQYLSGLQERSKTIW